MLLHYCRHKTLQLIMYLPSETKGYCTVARTTPTTEPCWLVCTAAKWQYCTAGKLPRTTHLTGSKQCMVSTSQAVGRCCCSANQFSLKLMWALPLDAAALCGYPHQCCSEPSRKYIRRKHPHMPEQQGCDRLHTIPAARSALHEQVMRHLSSLRHMSMHTL